MQGLDTTGIKRDKHPLWFPPVNKSTTGLNVLNSLTETVEPFAPREGRVVKWYTCGPTVYDMSHMGHARAYLTFDILRRIMEDYFGFSIVYQMNITDIDDKIIKRARINKLLDDFEAEKHPLDKLNVFVADAIEQARVTMAETEEKLRQPLPEGTSSRVRDERADKLKELELKKEQAVETEGLIAAAQKTGDAATVFKAARGVLGDLLDKLRGATVNDHSIFDAHARKFERAFFEDCAALGIKEPDVITRVTEVVPEVVTFIEKIIANGFAYKGETSVFFDTEAFIKAGHSYPKLKPVGDKKEDATDAEMAEGEGTLSLNTVKGEKKSPNDFALWKFSKPGEPQYPSPWGLGRPGWHIECSVMGSSLLGDNMDVHAGGCDLKFPHHDNEMAQSEAYHNNHQWVNYFFHCGHLSIKGLKMSKSLKNFITIRQALEGNQDAPGITPRQMRLLFLATTWHAGCNFNDQSIGTAKEQERVLRSFFGNVEAILRKDHLQGPQGSTAADIALKDAHVAAEGKVHAALCDNFDTVTALQTLMDLVSQANQYLLLDQRPSATLLRKVATYVTRILKVFGVVQGNDAIGLADAGAGSSESDAKLTGVVDALVSFRDDVRKAAKAKDTSSLLALSDSVRDKSLPPHGVRLEDKPDGTTMWKLDDPAILLREIAEKEAAAAEKVKTKARNQLETQKKLLTKWTDLREPPTKFFQLGKHAGRFSEYDANGLPTKTAEGEAVADKTLKQLKKDYDKYAASHKDFQDKGGDAFLDGMRKEIEKLEASLQ